MFAAPARPQDPSDRRDRELTELIDAGARNAALAYTSAYAMAFDALEVIELPPGAESRVDRAQMRALAALYLAADLEPAGVFGAAESLSALAANGALQVDLGPVAPLLHGFWRERHQRVTRVERLAFFSRLFGASYGGPVAEAANAQFETLMLELCEGLFQLGEGIHRDRYGGISQQTRIRTAARNLLYNLVRAGGGATPFMAREVMAGLKSALAILKHPHLHGIFGARDIWGVIASIGRLTRTPPLVEPQLFVRRGRAGMTLIVWLADAAETLRSYGAPLVELDHPVIAAAVDWLQASLSISELQPRAMPAQPPPADAGLSDWADLGI